MFYNCQKQRVFVFGFTMLFLFSAFTLRSLPLDLKWAENCLKTCFDSSAGNAKLKKWELSITDSGFFRLKKVYQNGKQEYFSFNLKKFEDLKYLGTAEMGEIVLKTQSDDIIVQTYNDTKGNIDSMAKSLRISVTNIQPETLDSLRSCLSRSLR